MLFPIVGISADDGAGAQQPGHGGTMALGFLSVKACFTLSRYARDQAYPFGVPTLNAQRCDETRRLLQERPRSLHLEHIARDTGLAFGWLKAFSRGAWNSSRGNRVEILHNYLTSRKA